MSKKRVEKIRSAVRKKSAIEKKAKIHTQKKPFLSGIFEKKKLSPSQEYRKKEENDLRDMQHKVGFLWSGEPQAKKPIPAWFYIVSVFAAFMFTIYISIFATIHFESIEYMNMTIVFLFIAMVSYFLISLVFFVSEEKGLHWIPAFLFFAGVSTIMVYAFKAIDTSNLVRFSIIYTIIVAAISTYVLAVKRK